MSASTPGSPSYGEGERVLGPPQGTYDADWVAASARQQDPGLPEHTARELAVYAWDHLRDMGRLDAPELARRLLADHHDAGATPATVVARAAVDFCREHAVELPTASVSRPPSPGRRPAAAPGRPGAVP